MVAVSQRGEFEPFFRRHHPFVRTVLRSLGVPGQDLDDASQEVFIVVYRKATLVTVHAGARRWLGAICARVAANHRRKLRRRRETLLGEVPEQTASHRASDRVEARETLEAVRHRLAQLDRSMRAVFDLRVVHEAPMQSVAHQVGCSLATAYARLSRVRNHLRDGLAEPDLR